MTVKALLCELNPLHNGHRFIINEAKRNSDCVVGIMSGNFTQRSEPALFDKYLRAEDAINAGIDVVLELPFPWSSSSAAFFAAAGVSVAERIGANELVFASECGDIAEIRRAAEVSAMFDNEILKTDRHSVDGIAAMREKYAIEHGISPSLFRTPNNILAAEYVRFAGDSLSLSTVKRRSGPCYASATDVRKLLLSNGDAGAYVPQDLYAGYVRRISGQEYAVNSELADIERRAFIFSESDSAGIFDADGGLGERITDAARRSVSGVEMIEKAKTKKYTDSRIRRAALYMMLGVTETDIRALPEYTLLLGMSENGRKYLSSLRKTSRIPIITKPADYRELSDSAARQFELSARADMLWCECAEKPIKPDFFMKKHPFIL